MAKWQDRVNKIIEVEQLKLKAKYKEYEGNWRDTGYDRYYNAMERLENELDELELFRNSKLAVIQAENKTRRYRKVMTEYLSSMSAYAENHKGVERPVDETVKELKHRLQRALNEEGLL